MRETHFGSPTRAPTGFLRRFIIGLAVAVLTYATAVLVVLIDQGDEIDEGVARFAEALARPALFLVGAPARQPTCDDCVLLRAGSHVRLGTDTVALLWELRPAAPQAELFVRGAFVPRGADRVPVDSGSVALVPRRAIRARDTTVLDVVPRDSAVLRGLRARGRFFTDAPDVRAYAIFW